MPIASRGTPTEAIVVVQSGSSGTLLAANADRRGLVVQNLDPTAKVTLRLDGSAVTAGSGLVLNPAGGAGQGGGALTLTDTACPQGAITARADTGTPNVYVAELT